MPARTCVRARAAAGAGPGSGSGLGLSLSSGSGSLPGLLLFESGLTGMGCKHTRIRPAPLRIQTARQRTRSTSVATVGSNHCNGSVSNRCNLSLGSDPLAPPGAL